MRKSATAGSPAAARRAGQTLREALGARRRAVRRGSGRHSRGRATLVAGHGSDPHSRKDTELGRSCLERRALETPVCAVPPTRGRRVAPSGTPPVWVTASGTVALGAARSAYLRSRYDFTPNSARGTARRRRTFRGRTATPRLPSRPDEFRGARRRCGRVRELSRIDFSPGPRAATPPARTGATDADASRRRDRGVGAGRSAFRDANTRARRVQPRGELALRTKARCRDDVPGVAPQSSPAQPPTCTAVPLALTISIPPPCPIWMFS
jgi:hypothetical protein